MDKEEVEAQECQAAWEESLVGEGEVEVGQEHYALLCQVYFVIPS